MTDRYADAVRARRAELRAAAAALGGCRAELRAASALARIAAADVAGGGLRALTREAHRRIAVADRAQRSRLPGEVTVGLRALRTAAIDAAAAELRPRLRRLAGAHDLDLPPRWSRLTVPVGADVVCAPPPTPASAVLTGGAGVGIALLRLGLLPLTAVGLPALGGAALVPPAVGVAVGGLLLLGWLGLVGGARAALRVGVAEAVAAARSAMDADLSRALVAFEQAAGTALDGAVDARRRAVEARLRELTGPGRG